MPDILDVVTEVGSCNYMTPPWLCDVIRRHADAAGHPITLDPCTAELFNARGLQAPKIYTQADDGLAKSWDNESVYVNPPGGKSRPGAKAWWQKLVSSQCTNGYYLSFTLASLQWSQSVQPISDFPCIVFAQRLKFWEPVEQAVAALERTAKPSASRVDRLLAAIEGGSGVIETECPVSACMLTLCTRHRKLGTLLQGMIRDTGHWCELL